MKTYEYTYTVKEVNIHNAHILVEYISADVNLISHTLNLPAYIKNEDDTIVDFVQVIKDYAPHLQWEAQEYLKEQYDNIMNKTDTVV